MTDLITDEMLARRRTERAAQRAREASLLAPSVSPDDMARADRYAREQGAPPLAVADNLADFDQRDHLDRVQRAAQDAPKAAGWLARPENVALVKDDLDGVVSVSKAANRADTWFGAVVGSLFPGAGPTADHLAQRFQAADVRMFADTTQGAADFLQSSQVAGGVLRKLAELGARDALRRGNKDEAARLLAEADSYSDALGFQRISREAAGIGREAAADQRSLVGQNQRPASPIAAIRDPGNTLRYYGGLFTDSLPAMLAAMATRNPAAASAAMGATTGAATYADVRGEGKGKLDALKEAIPQAGIESVFSRIPFDEAFRPGVSRFVRAPVAEALSEGVTEIAQTEVSDVIRGEVTPTREKWLQAMDAMLVGAPGGLVEAALGGEVPDATAKRWVNVARLSHDRGYLDSLVQAAQGAKLFKRSPARFEDLLQEQVGDSVVYVPVEDLEALFQSESLDPGVAVEALTGDANAWAEAQAAGGAIAIPLARYVTRLGDAHAALAKKVTLDADSVLEAEDAADLQLPTREQIHAEIESALAAARTDDTRENGPAGQVYDEIYGQLLSRTDEASARQQAAVVQSLYRNLAERVGTDAMSLWQRFRLNIGAPKAPTAGQQRGVDLAMDPLIEAALSGKTFTDRDIYGGSLVPAIVALGGINPDSVGGGDLRAADAMRRPGLVSMTGMTVERMAETLADNGWRGVFANTDEFGRPDYRELVDLIRDELGGSPVYNRVADNDRDAMRMTRREAFRRDAEAIAGIFARYAEQTGKPITELSREEQRALAMTAFEEDPGALDQPAYHGTPHTVDRFSLQKIGTGEGNQAYGWGLYFASQREIAEHYRYELSARSASDRSDRAGVLVNIALKSADGDATKALAIAKRNDNGSPLDAEVIRRLESGERPGKTYRVDVPEDGDLLDWDKPLSEQPEKVRESIKLQVVKENEPSDSKWLVTLPGGQQVGFNTKRDAQAFVDGATGEMLYKTMAVSLGQKGASHALFEAGIPGLRYLDGISRGQGEGSHNYVIWDEDAISEPEALYQSAPPVESEAFRRWFGESEVIADGQPMVVYHGAPASFDEFDGDENVAGWFAEDPSTAARYAGNENRFSDTTRPQTYAVYLSIQNPANFSFDMNDPIDVVWNDARELGIENPESLWPKPRPGVHNAAWEAVRSDRFMQALRDNGFDGIRVREKGAWTWAAFRPEQIKSATANRGTFDPNDPNILYQSEQPFYSQLIRVVEAAKQDKAPGAQWLGWLSNQGGLKKEELEFYDLPAWLSGQKSVTREALLEYLRANELVVEESTMGREFKEIDLRNLPFQAAQDETGGWNVRGPDGQFMYSPGRLVGDSLDSLRPITQDEAERDAYEVSSGAVRSQTGTPLPMLGDGYVVERVTAEDVDLYGLDEDEEGKWGLFEAPRPDGQRGEWMGTMSAPSYAEAVRLALQQVTEFNGAGEAEAMGFTTPEAPYANLTLPGGTGYKVMLLRLPETLGAKPNADGYTPLSAIGDAQFTGGHWREPNVVAHVRFDERTDADGKRVLFVQELQSDWHQHGRRHGYRGQAPSANYPSNDQMAAELGWALRPATQADAGKFGLPNPEDFVHLTYSDGSVSLYGNDTVEEAVRSEWANRQRDRFYAGKGAMPDAEWAALAQMVEALDRDEKAKSSSAVPDAPFKTTWPELVMKRMVRYAAENGFDRVAWPTPEQVPRIEGWGTTLAEIKASPDSSKRFGAILERYATEVPRIAKALAKKLGGRVVTSTLEGGSPASDSWLEFTRLAAGPVQLVSGPGYWGEVKRRVFEAVDPAVEDLRGADLVAAVDRVRAQIADADGFPEVAEALEAAASEVARRQEPVANQAIEITPQMREAVLAGLPLFQKKGGKGPRGSITGRDGKSIVRQKPDEAGVREFNIQLLDGADVSTFLHESAHAFLEILGDLAEAADAPQQVKDDWTKTLAWLGVADRKAIGRDQHEQWARGWEAYYREGNAPSSALRRAFAQFKVWLTALYKSALSLNVNLTDEVRGVFDRMLASDAEIAMAREQVYQEALIGDALAVGMTEAEHDAYQRAVQAAREEQEAELAAELLKAEQRAQQAWWRAERRALRAEVEAEFRALPVYRAIRWLRNGKLPDGEPVPQAVKLDKEALLDEFGQSFLQHLRGMYATSGGVSADQAAALLGFASGGELVHALVNAPPLQPAIDAETDARMAARHPDPLTDGSLPDRAMAAVHSDKQAEVMLREIRAIEGHVGGQASTTAELMREVARRLISEKRARDIQPNLYRQAEAKAGREAFKAAAAGDWAGALAARRRQLLNLRLYQEATRVRAEAASIGKYLGRFTKTKVRAKLGKAGHDYLEQIDALLERFDFRAVSNKASDRRARLRDWIQSKREAGVDVDLPAKLLDDAFAVPFRDLTVADLRMVRDAVKHLAHLADLKNTLLLKGERLDREAVDAAMAESVTDAHASRPDHTGDTTPREKARTELLKIRGVLAAATDIARELDGFKDVGAVWANTVRVIREAVYERVNPALIAAQEAMAAIYTKHYTPAELRDFKTRRFMPEVGDAWSKDRLLALALNWGNEGNREAILTQARGRLTAEQVGLLLTRLDERDWRFVQDVWDYVDSYWPAIAEIQKQRKGLVPEKVPASAFAVTLPDGRQLAVNGGYFPLRYVPDSTRGLGEEADDFFESIRTGRFSKASTKDGHTIERVGSGGRTVMLELSVVDTHLRDVIRDLHLGDAVNYVYQALRGPRFRAAVDDAGLMEFHKALEVWLKDVAAGEIGVRTAGMRALRAIRTNFTASVLTYKATSAALQVTGLVQTSVVLGKRFALEGVLRYTRRPLAAARYVDAASPFMAARVHSHVEAVQQVMDAEAGRFESGRQAMMRWGYWMIGRVQRTVDLATWLGAEAKGMEMFGGDVGKARAYADDVVSRAQGSGEFIDKTPLQRGSIDDSHRQSEIIRASTVLMSYMMAKSNAAYGRTRVTDFRRPKEALKWAGDMLNLFVVEGILATILRGQWPDDEEDDGTWDEWLGIAAREGFGNLFGGIPGLSQMVSELRGYDAKGVIASAWESVGSAIEQAKQGELDKAAIKSSVSVAGFALGIPASQINKTIDAIAAQQAGEDVHPLHYLVGPPKKAD